MPVLVLFRSLTTAQRAARLLEREAFRIRLGRAPSGVTDSGCAYCLHMEEADLSAALRLLDGSGIRRGRVFRREGDGYREVAA